MIVGNILCKTVGMIFIAYSFLQLFILNCPLPIANSQLLSIVNCQLTIEIAGTVVGLIYLWLEYRASIYLWIAGIIMPAIYVFVYYEAGLYADVGINIYYMLAAIYGWLVWTLGGKKHRKGELPITRTPVKNILPLALVFTATFLGITWLLINFTNSDVPWWDSFTTALSIIAMWMLAKKYVEQWLVWIVVDITSSGLYIYKDLYFTAALYALYTIIAIFGYLKWRQIMSQQAT